MILIPSLSDNQKPVPRYLHVIGKAVWRKWKRRYMVLVQVSQYTFALCSYKDKKSEPAEMMQLDGFTVDYIEFTSGKTFAPLLTLRNYDLSSKCFISLLRQLH